VRQRGYLGRLNVGDIIALHEQGVREPVITALQSNAAQRGQLTPVAASGPQTVVVDPYRRPAPVVIEHRVLPSYPPPYYRPARQHYFYFHR
ncbi:MAG: hypothetical protein AAGJ83_15045, partial [Planctomycetota bacterium]